MCPVTLEKEVSLNKKEKPPSVKKEGVYGLKCRNGEAIYVVYGKNIFETIKRRNKKILCRNNLRINNQEFN